MPDYKSNLIKLLRETVAELYSGGLMYHEITDSGFFCDFDLPEPLNPEKIIAISNLLTSKKIRGVYELTGFSGVYLDGDRAKKMLQRICQRRFEIVVFRRLKFVGFQRWANAKN